MGRLFLVLGLVLLLIGSTAGLTLVFADAEFTGPLPNPCPSATPEAAEPSVAPEPSAPPLVPLAATPTPQPCFSPPPVTPPKHHLLGDGPIDFSGSGGLDVGTHRIFSPIYSQQDNNVGVSMSLSVQRRTQQTSLSITNQVGFIGQTTTVGQITVGYQTPKYGITYGQIAGPGQTQLAIAGFAKGLMLSLPRRNGEIDLLGSTALGNSGETFHVYGLRRYWLYRRSSLLATVLSASGEQSGARSSIADLAFATYHNFFSSRFEVAYNRTSGLSTAADGGRLAYAAEVDINERHGFDAFLYRAIPNNFSVLGDTLTQDHSYEVTTHRIISGFAVNVDYFRDRNFQLGQVNDNARLTASVSKTMRFGALTGLFTRSANVTPAGSTVTTSEGVSLSQNFRNFGLSEILQTARTTGDGGVASQSQFSLGLTRVLFGGAVQIQGTIGHVNSNGQGSVQHDLTFGFARPVGRKLTIGFIGDFNGFDSAGSTFQRSFALTATRRLSPVLGLQLGVVRSLTSGIVPTRVTSLDANLTAPLLFGTAARYNNGRINPHLPAIIGGHVYYASATFDGSTQQGVANVLVSLDHGITQRTDAQGGYSFHLVPPGTHTVSIEPGTIGGGLIADHDSHTVRVVGGQSVIVDYAVGAFAAVAGKVQIKTAEGYSGVGNVILSIDDQQRVITDELGHYSFGRLTPGTHRVSVIADSLPATAQIDGPVQRSVQVTQSAITLLDWSLVGLGSIKGSVLYTADSGFGDLTGAKDVYVVANPGDHAGITDPDGSFILDDLPPGTYTLSVDPETLPDGQSVVSGPEGTVTINGGEQMGGVVFKVGPKAKEVIFTFSGGKKTPITASFEPARVPPGAEVRVIARTAAKVSAMAASGDLGTFALRYDAALKGWIGGFVVPELAAGDYALHLAGTGANASSDVPLTVDPTIPLINARVSPSHPRGGQIIHVVAHILAPLDGPARAVFDDGYSVAVPPAHGHITAFDMRLWSHGLPYSGFVVTGKTRIPLTLDRTVKQP